MGVNEENKKSEIKAVFLKCSTCGVIWKKHWKKIVSTRHQGKTTVPFEKWIPSKEVHHCKPQDERQH